MQTYQIIKYRPDSIKNEMLNIGYLIKDNHEYSIFVDKEKLEKSVKFFDQNLSFIQNILDALDVDQRYLKHFFENPVDSSVIFFDKPKKSLLKEKLLSDFLKDNFI